MEKLSTCFSSILIGVCVNYGGNGGNGGNGGRKSVNYTLSSVTGSGHVIYTDFLPPLPP